MSANTFSVDALNSNTISKEVNFYGTCSLIKKGANLVTGKRPMIVEGSAGKKVNLK